MLPSIERIGTKPGRARMFIFKLWDNRENTEQIETLQYHDKTEKFGTCRNL